MERRRRKQRAARRGEADTVPARSQPSTDGFRFGAPTSWPPWAIAAAVALAVRLLYFATASGPAFSDPLIDADYNDYLGGRLARGEGFDPGPFWQPPLYPMFLGALYSVFGQSLAIARVAQALLGGGVAAMTADLASRASGERRVGLGAGLLVAFHGPLVFYDGELLATSLATALGTLGAWLALRAAPSWRSALASGAAIGAAALAVAPMGALIVPVAWAAWGGRASRSLLCVAACVALILPATLANHARSGEWIAVSANGGVNLWIGNNADADRTVAIRPGREWDELLNEPVVHGAGSPGRADAYFSRKARAWCAGDPLACAGGVLRKARLLLVSRELPRNEDIHLLARQSPVLRVLVARAGSVALPYVLLLPLALAGGVWAVRSRRREALGVLFVALALAAGPLIFFVTGRYRAPMAPALCALAALGVLALRARMTVAILAGSAALLLAVLPVRTAVDAVNFEAEMHFAVAGRRARLGDSEGAIGSYRRALEMRQDYLEARSNLALELQKVGRFRDAAIHYRHILRAEPEDEATRLRLGWSLLGAGDLEAAERELGAIVAKDARHVDALVGLAQARLGRRDLRGAHAYAVEADAAAGGRDPEVEALREGIESALAREAADRRGAR